MAGVVPLKSTVSIEEWMAAIKETKNTVLRKKSFRRLNTVTYKEKTFLGTATSGSQSFLYFTKIFVHLIVIAAAC